MATERHAGGRPRELELSPVGKIIDAEIRSRGLHDDVVAESAGISRPTLHRIKTGGIESPRVSTLFAIAAAIGCQPEKLLAAFSRRGSRKKVG
jgi:DNA-binding Xre family transcriptional regulator